MTQNPAPLWRRAFAEAIGTGALVAVVVGSGIMAARLSLGDVGVQLLENSTATALGLAVIIAVFITVSGAHLNPAVSLGRLAVRATQLDGTTQPGSGRLSRRPSRRRHRRRHPGQPDVRVSSYAIRLGLLVANRSLGLDSLT